jgi:hypothetical protein
LTKGGGKHCRTIGREAQCTAISWAQRRASAPSRTGWVRARLRTDCMPEALRALRSMPGLARASDFSAQNSFFVFYIGRCVVTERSSLQSSILRVCFCLSFGSLLVLSFVFFDAHVVVLIEELSRGSRLVCDNFSYFIRFFSLPLLPTQNMTEANSLYIN